MTEPLKNDNSTQAAQEDSPVNPSRRSFLTTSTVGMLAGLGASYGFLTYMGGAFLYPNEGPEARPHFVALTGDFAVGESREWRAPDGAKVLVTRVATKGDVDDFRALSNVCPHLGCKVHWQAAQNRFFCPCHNGVFDPEGKATEGPPAEAGQKLASYQLEIKGGALYV
ncbi:MAG: ubiquinol-cytochrome c reductase iron-sulfur subunit, partial [Nitrospira sp.]|nr:ubiquinol-cytochrome c reductase iron-sulfur subunit [Nitrospira sp.]